MNKLKRLWKKLFGRKDRQGPLGRRRTGGNTWWDQNRPN